MQMQIQVEMGVPSRVASPKASRWFPAYRERGRHGFEEAGGRRQPTVKAQLTRDGVFPASWSPGPEGPVM